MPATARQGESRESEPGLAERFTAVRAQSVALCAPLEIEDYGVQPMDDASPPKWHLAHTTWFFETFLLKSGSAGFTPFHPAFETLFNSYYNGVGDPYPRPRRGLLSRPTVAEVLQYREWVDERVLECLAGADQAVADIVELGLHHEQQHQELLLTDLKYNLGNNPLHPAYRDDLVTTELKSAAPLEFVSHPGGVVEVGADADAFCFDNETPRHDVLLSPHALGSRLITNAEFLAFMEDEGYARPELWLSEGWARVCESQWRHPLYWRRVNGEWYEYRLSGLAPLCPETPVVHLSGFEADAYARWRGCRLPTEFELETAVAGEPLQGNFVDQDALHPLPSAGSAQWFGDAWEWTCSSYGAYPGYRPLPGTLGEYNGKFMSSQLVLRGGSCATPAGHLRRSYRNFFYPGDRWQFSGVRLARDE